MREDVSEVVDGAKYLDDPQLKPESEKVLSNHQCRAALKQAEDKYVALLYDLAVTQKCPELKLSLVKLLNLEERARTAARVLA